VLFSMVSVYRLHIRVRSDAEIILERGAGVEHDSDAKIRRKPTVWS